MAKNVDGKWRFVVKLPNHNHPASPPKGHPLHQHLDDTGCCCGHCVVIRIGHNSKTCPEHSRIMVIQRPVIEEPANYFMYLAIFIMYLAKPILKTSKARFQI